MNTDLESPFFSSDFTPLLIEIYPWSNIADSGIIDSEDRYERSFLNHPPLTGLLQDATRGIVDGVLVVVVWCVRSASLRPGH